MYHLLSCLRKKKIPLYRHFSDFKSHCGFSIAGAGYTIFPVREGYFVFLIISTSNGSVFWVFYDYKALYLSIYVLLPRLFCFYIYFFSDS